MTNRWLRSGAGMPNDPKVARQLPSSLRQWYSSDAKMLISSTDDASEISREIRDLDEDLCECST